MLTGTQTLPKMVLPSKALEISSMPQLLDNAKLLQMPTSQPAVLPLYAESDYHWLVGVLDKLIGFMRRDENHSLPELTENDYDWAHALLVELVGAVGESETHPLRPLMEFVCQLIDNYEDKYVPELTELFPELAEEAPIETANKSKKFASNIPKQSESELAAHAFFSIGFLLYHGNRTEKAISAYDTAIVVKPDFWEAYNNQGIIRNDLEQYIEAIPDFNKAIELNQNFADTYYCRGISYSQLGQYKKAMSDFNKAIELNQDFTDAYYNLGTIKAELGNYAEAIVDFNKAIALKPNFVEAYHNRGIALGKLGKSDKAIVDFDKAIALKPNSAEFYLNRGAAKGNSGQQEAAIADFDKAIELDPKNTKAYYYNGIAKNQLGAYQAAIIDFDTVIALKPDYVPAYNYRGNLRQELGIHDDALTDFNKAIHINPDYAEAYNSRGNLNGSLGQYHDALADCNEAIRLNSEYAEAYANRGMAKAGLERIDEAKSDLQTALELAEQQNNTNLKAFVENQLQQLNQVPSNHNNKEPRRGGQMQTHIVTRVIDGNTLEVSPEISRRAALQTPMERLMGARLAETSTQGLENSNMFNKIRLRNIDTPESGTPQGEKAIRYLKQFLEGKQVTFKPVGISHDRVVADVWRYPDHVFVNAIMVYSGHAKWSHPPR